MTTTDDQQPKATAEATEVAGVSCAAPAGSGDWDVERTHGRLCKVQYDVGCKEADQYCDKLRADGWKAWSVSSDGKRVTEVFYLRYTNTANERQLPSQNDQADPLHGRGKTSPEK